MKITTTFLEKTEKRGLMGTLFLQRERKPRKLSSRTLQSGGFMEGMRLSSEGLYYNMVSVSLDLQA
jgi:hypothetical protein